MSEKVKYLYYVQRPSYAIALKAREKGYYACTYHILSYEESRLMESSQMKIFHRLVYSLSISINQFTESEIDLVFHDLEIISKQLKIPEAYEASEILKLRESLK